MYNWKGGKDNKQQQKIKMDQNVNIFSHWLMRRFATKIGMYCCIWNRNERRVFPLQAIGFLSDICNVRRYRHTQNIRMR